MAEAARVKRERFLGTYADLAPRMAALRAAGVSLAGIAAALNADGEKTATGLDWNKVQVLRVLRAHPDASVPADLASA